MNVTSCIAVFSTCLFSQLEFNFSRPNPSWCHLTSWSCILACSCTARCRYLHWKLMAFCPLRWLHFHNLKQRGDHKQLVSNHFIDLKHAHMAVCFSFCLFFFIKKAVSLFCGKVQKECWNGTRLKHSNPSSVLLPAARGRSLVCWQMSVGERTNSLVFWK